MRPDIARKYYHADIRIHFIPPVVSKLLSTVGCLYRFHPETNRRLGGERKEEEGQRFFLMIKDELLM
ncbi:MAG: hypothetical protein K2H01_11440, partial [Ruminococcus sp.]|nr:hypothetical protein [Ruminococcus sp.]